MAAPCRPAPVSARCATCSSAAAAAYDTNGYTTSWPGTLTDVQRTLTIENSNASGTGAVGAVTFGSLAAGATTTIAVNAGAGTAGGNGTSVTFAGGINRSGDTDAGATANATVFINPATGSNLGVGSTNGVQVFSSGPSTTLTNGIVPAWIMTDNGGSASANPYNFLTYSSTNGYQVATNYTSTFGASNVVKLSSNTSVTSNSQAYALNVQNSKTVTIGAGNTLTVGDGSNPAGLILEGTTSITGGTLAFGSSEAVDRRQGYQYDQLGDHRHRRYDAGGFGHISARRCGRWPQRTDHHRFRHAAAQHSQLFSTPPAAARPSGFRT